MKSLLILTLGILPVSGSVVFSNNFEDSNLTPEIGSWTFNSSPNTSLVAAGGDPILGTQIALLDLESSTGPTLDISIPLPTAADITNGNSITFSFEVAARRTNGFAKTTYITALDSNGDEVAQFVLGDSNAYGNTGGDRQRPGYGTDAGRVGLGTSFFWGADTNSTDGFNGRDAGISFTITDAGMDISGRHQNNAANDFTQTGLPLWDSTATFTDIASFEITSEGNGYGLYWDNITIETIPEPSVSLLGLLSLAALLRRRR